MAQHNAQQSLLTLLDDAPQKPIHYWLWMLSSGGTLLDGFSIFALGVALPLIVGELGIGASQVGMIGSAVVLGAILGAAAGGPAADRFGRKKLLIADMLIVAMGSAISTIASGWIALFVGQLIVGIGIGSDFPVGGAYVSELMPKKHRGRMMVATIACQSIGMLLAAGVTVTLLNVSANQGLWRWFFASGGVIATLFVAARLWMPESPRWLMTQGRNAEAARVVGRVLPESRSAAETLAASAANATHHVALVEQCQRPPGIGTLMRPEYRTRTILVTVPWFLMDMATYGVGLFTPVILGAIHLSSQPSGPLAADLADAKGSAAIDLFLLVGFLVSLWAVPKFGRIRMQIIGFGGMAIGMSILLAGTCLPGGAHQHLWLVFTGFILFNLLMNAGPNATTFTLAPEYFPTQLRASAAGFAASIAKLGATLGVFVLPIVKSHFGIPAVLALMAGVSLAALLVTLLFAREVTEGVPLEAHQQATDR